MAGSSQIIIREIALNELRAVEDLQIEIWGCSDREVLPALALIPLQEVGGVLLGAFDNEHLVGFVFAFPGFESERPILHSDMLAVKDEYRSQGLGYRLKLAQRQHAIAKGVDRITWTFDPLQSRNAYLNIAKLGVVADRYRPNFYGNTSSFLHRTGTDRLWVTWFLNSDRVKQRLAQSAPTVIPFMEIDSVPVLLRSGVDEEPKIMAEQPFGAASIIEIPHDINAITAIDTRLADCWRQATRQVFTRAIDLGYLVEEFYVVERGGRKTGMYVLRKTAG